MQSERQFVDQKRLTTLDREDREMGSKCSRTAEYLRNERASTLIMFSE